MSCRSNSLHYVCAVPLHPFLKRKGESGTNLLLLLRKEALNNDLARSGLFLLENDSIDRNKDSNAEGSEYSKRHFDFLILHPVQIVHVLCVKIVWFIMAMCMTSSHPLHPC